MNEAQKILGACVRVLREQRALSLEALAAKAGISYQYLSGVETGKENFSIRVLESLALALDLPMKALVVAAYEGLAETLSPRLEASFFRSTTPLPDGLTIEHVREATNITQTIIHRINRNLRQEIGQPLQALIQGNNFESPPKTPFTAV